MTWCDPLLFTCVNTVQATLATRLHFRADHPLLQEQRAQEGTHLKRSADGFLVGTERGYISSRHVAFGAAAHLLVAAQGRQLS